VAGEMVGHNLDKVIIPASVSKLYTSYVGLKTLGANFRFETQFHLSQQEGKTTLFINGDFDGYFVVEHLFFLLSKLNKLGVEQIDELLFDQKFYVNFYLDQASIKSELLKYLNTAGWTQKTKDWYFEIASQVQDYGLDMGEQLPKMHLKNVTFRPNLPKNPASFVFNSSPLLKHLKEMNIYSNNYYAQALFQKIGHSKFNQVLYEDLSTTSKQLQFNNGSGLPGNFTTCRLTLMLLDLLQRELKMENFTLQNIASLAGYDRGTLYQRFRDYSSSQAVVAKTGTLPSLSISTLAGVASTSEGEKPFAIFNQYHGSSMERAKKFQESVVDSIIEASNGKEEYPAQAWTFFPLEDLKIL
jgi:D-alanyl-D-alanine carboxypeptidase/D-alanyl-D-alanine-endopeptidase (penicillin-binding protein 4)